MKADNQNELIEIKMEKPIAPEVEVKDVSRKDFETRKEYLNFKKEIKKQWSEYNQQMMEYNFLLEAKDMLVNPPEEAYPLIILAYLIERLQIPIDLKVGEDVNTSENHIAQTRPKFHNSNTNNVLTHYFLKGFEIIFDRNKIFNLNESQTVATLSINYDLDLMYDNDYGVPTYDKTYEHKLIRPTAEMIMGHEWGHVLNIVSFLFSRGIDISYISVFDYKEVKNLLSDEGPSEYIEKLLNQLKKKK